MKIEPVKQEVDGHNSEKRLVKAFIPPNPVPATVTVIFADPFPH